MTLTQLALVAAVATTLSMPAVAQPQGNQAGALDPGLFYQGWRARSLGRM